MSPAFLLEEAVSAGEQFEADPKQFVYYLVAEIVISLAAWAIFPHSLNSVWTTVLSVLLNLLWVFCLLVGLAACGPRARWLLVTAPFGLLGAPLLWLVLMGGCLTGAC
jgi:hypothetical protein